jgi:hypothetical protein
MHDLTEDDGEGTTLIRVKFVYRDGTWRTAEMPECPRLGEYVDAGLTSYHVASVRWEPFQDEEDEDLAYDVLVQLEVGMAQQDREKYIKRTQA